MASASTKKQIYNLLAIFFCAVTIGIGMAAYMAYSYGPSGHYIAKDALLSPEVLSKISYRTYDTKSGKTLHFIFDKIEFTYYNKTTKNWKNRNIDVETYRKFYNLISEEKSLPDITPEITSLFKPSNLPQLTLSIKPVESTDNSRPFQQVQFSPEGNYFRVELHEDAPTKEPWAYFQYSDIYHITMDLFNAG